jgi:hypothetical protein
MCRVEGRSWQVLLYRENISCRVTCPLFTLCWPADLTSSLQEKTAIQKATHAQLEYQYNCSPHFDNLQSPLCSSTRDTDSIAISSAARSALHLTRSSNNSPMTTFEPRPPLRSISMASSQRPSRRSAKNAFDDDDAPPAKRQKADDGAGVGRQENQVNGHAQSGIGRKKKQCKRAFFY